MFHTALQSGPIVELIGWISTVLNLISILTPNRRNLHLIGFFAATATFVYAVGINAQPLIVKWAVMMVLQVTQTWKHRHAC